LIPQRNNGNSSAGVPLELASGSLMSGPTPSAEDTKRSRLHVFDEQLANRLSKERPAMIITSLLVLALGIILGVVAYKMVDGMGGLTTLSQMDYKYLRSLRFGALVNQQVLFIVTAGLALSCYLCAFGQFVRFIVAGRAIASVKAGQLPDIVGVHFTIKIGLMIGAVLCPPLGLILGIIFKFTNSIDLKTLGSRLIYLSLLVIGIVIVNVVWDMAATAITSKQSTPSPPDTGKEALLDLASYYC